MNHASQLELAHRAAARPLLIASQSDLGRAAKAWNKSTILALDTEFVRVNTYYANLGLIQLSDGQTVWLIDPLALTDPEPIIEVLENPAILKLIHAPSEDLEVLLQAYSVLPRPFIDTQRAQALLGETPQIGYHGLIAQTLGLELEKGATRTNWCKRPLSTSQLKYAAEDVAYLPMVWAQMEAEIMQLGRMSWLEEDAEAMLAKAARPVNPNKLYLRHPGAQRLEQPALTVLRALAGFRDSEAVRANRPRSFIIKDPVLTNIAITMPETLDELSAIDELPAGVVKRLGKTLLRVIEEARNESPPAPAPPERLTTSQQKKLKRLKASIADVAEELNIAPTLLAARRDLESLIRRHAGADGETVSLPKGLRGWRGELLGELLLSQLDN